MAMTSEKIRNYHDVVDFTEWYLKNKAPDEGATTKEIRDYIMELDLFLEGYEPSVSRMGHIIGNSKRFDHVKRHSKKYGYTMNFWTIKR